MRAPRFASNPPWWLACVAIWATAVALLTMAGLGGVRILDLREGYDPVIRVSPEGIPGIWARWDSPYYVDLARNGYRALPHARGYFPLYPLLMRGLTALAGFRLATSGMIISQLAYLASLLLLYRLALRLRDDRGYALRCVLAMAVFPSSFFFAAVYAESLALAFSLAAMLLLLRDRPSWPGAGLAIGVASAARPVGWLLNVVALSEFLRRRRFDRSRLAAFAIAVVLAGSGIALFVLYLRSISGSFFAIRTAQRLWLRTWAAPWTTLGESVRLLLGGNGVADDWFLAAMNGVDLAFTLFALALTAVALRRALQRRFPWSLALLLLVWLLFLLSQKGPGVVPLWGMTRWVAALFPLYLILGDFGRHGTAETAFLLGSAFLQLAMMGWWASGRWVG